MTGQLQINSIHGKGGDFSDLRAMTQGQNGYILNILAEIG
jgi:hypothetical protein